MRKLFLLTVFSSLATLGFGQKVTFSSDVASIIYDNCTSCHRQGAIAPFSLESYQDVYNNRFAILNDVQNHVMPPWSPNPSYTHFLNEKKLSPDQISKITNWVSGGAERGDVAQEPKTPVFNDGSQLSNVDFSSRCDYHTVTKNEDDFEFFALPSGLAIDAYVKQMELVPLNRKIVHHIFVFIDSTGNFADFVKNGDAHINGNNYISGGSMSELKLIGGWLPGGSYSTVPDNMGIHVPKGSFYIVQIHYAPGSNGQSDATQLNIKYSRTDGLRNMAMTPLLDNVLNMQENQIRIPANAVQTYHEKLTLDHDISLVSITPHMHKIGVHMKVFALRPNGHGTDCDTIRLIDDKWDFHWQGMYTFPKMVHLMSGDMLCAEGTYDNTSNNKSNPNYPPIEIEQGTSTLTEMMQVFFCFLPYQSGDENVSLATVNLPAADPSVLINCNVYPNPVISNTSLMLSIDPPGAYNVSVCAADGREIFTRPALDCSTGTVALPMADVPRGLYFLKINNSKNMVVKKFQVED